MAKPALLLLAEFADRLLGGELADRFEIIRLWQAADPDALLAERGADVVAALTWRLDAGQIARLPNLKLIAVPGAGYEGVDVAAAHARGIVIANAGAAHSTEVADHALALIIAAIHRLPEQIAFAREGAWGAGAPQIRRRSMSSQRFGIVGLGAIGAAIAERLEPFGGEVAWWGPRRKLALWLRKDSLLELARWSSVLIIAARGDAAGLVDADVIDAVGPEGLIVNISRGAVIDEEALISALKAGRLGQAALDVFATEPTPPERWRELPNVILTPHVAGVSHESLLKLRAAAVRNLTTALDGGPVVNEIRG